MAEEGIQEGQHGDTPVGNDRPDFRPQKLRVVCPRCFRSTDSLKVYDESVVSVTPKVAVSCPPCMRRSILRRALLVFPWSFVYMPFFAWILIQDYRASREEGHTDLTVAEAHGMSRDEQFGAAVSFLKERRKRRREWLLFGLLVALIAGFWAALAYLS